jgi:hypothetical protein
MMRQSLETTGKDWCVSNRTDRRLKAYPHVPVSRSREKRPLSYRRIPVTAPKRSIDSGMVVVFVFYVNQITLRQI